MAEVCCDTMIQYHLWGYNAVILENSEKIVHIAYTFHTQLFAYFWQNWLLRW